MLPTFESFVLMNDINSKALNLRALCELKAQSKQDNLNKAVDTAL